MSAINPEELELSEKIVSVNRVAKVLKGGRRFSFDALIAVGDGKGHIGVGHGKAGDVSDAIRKGSRNAKRNIVEIPLYKGTIPHQVIGVYGASKVIIRPASPGTGVIAGGAVRAVLETVGVKDVLTKSLGSNSPHNLVKATMKGLLQLRSAEQIAKMRGLTIEELYKGVDINKSEGVEVKN